MSVLAQTRPLWLLHLCEDLFDVAEGRGGQCQRMFGGENLDVSEVRTQESGERMRTLTMAALMRFTMSAIAAGRYV